MKLNSSLLFGLFAATLLVACGGEVSEPAPAPEPAVAAPTPEPPPAEKEAPAGPLPALLMVQSWFPESGQMRPMPAKLTVWRTDGTDWYDEEILDKGSSVFHKAMPWRDGILTAGAGAIGSKPAAPAKLAHWTRDGDSWKETVLWSQAWEGKFQRLRDIEVADLDGDGQDEIMVATHDMGVVAVVDEGEDGTRTAQEFDKAPDTFVHEVEVGDVDGDGKAEFYVTPSGRNKASGESQAGGVARYDFKDGTYVKSKVVWWDESHAKEILVADMDADGTDELYVVKEGHVEKKGKRTKLIDPVTIVRMIPGSGGAWTEEVVAKLDGDPQCRFLFAGDVNHDGKQDLVAAGKDTGLWLLERQDDGTYTNSLIDKQSGGFEHAAVHADLDGDGKLEVYVASDKHKQFRRYVFNGEGWDREAVTDFAPKHITWNLQPAKL
jgi:hypothetical protein